MSAEVIRFPEPPPGRFDEPVHDPEAGRIPPHDLDAEAAVLSAAFIDDTSVARVRDALRPEHFYAESHRRIWEAVLEVHAAHTVSDLLERSCIVRVGERLKAHGRIEQVGGMAYLTELTNAAPAVENVVRYATIIHDRWRVRQVIAAAQEIAARGYLDGAVDVQGFADRATKRIARLAAANPFSPVPSNEETLRKILRACASPGDAERSETMVGYPTGLHTLDRHLGGLAAGHKLTIAATSGVGKTAFAGQVAIHVAKLGVGVAIFSTEITREEMLFRALANEGAVDSTRMKRAREAPLSGAELGRLAEAAKSLHQLPIVIDETSSLLPEQVRTRVAAVSDRFRLLHKVPLGLVIVDYVQRLDPSPAVARREKHHQVAYATKALKQIAQEFRICVLELAQAKPYEKDKRTKRFKMPRVDEAISDSKEIKNEADEVVFLVPQEKLENGAIDVTAYIAKLRGGQPKIEVSLEYHGAFYRFEDPNDPMRPASRDFLDLLEGGG